MMTGRRRARPILLVAVTLLLILAVLGGVGAAEAHAQEEPTATSTTLPVDSGNQSVIPLPNSGRRPQSSGDRGGWEQLLLAGILTVGCAVIFGRVLWAAHQRSRANALATQQDHPSRP
jgi:hypothetical protein